ncbi:MAG: hypothetical protein LBP85_10620 [Prevotellaceae bacterium]|jgi:outer membrane murein-binding lipoprotein Lpp|nr:hypothetical protein [Prevotellaceae bacterium]
MNNTNNVNGDGNTSVAGNENITVSSQIKECLAQIDQLNSDKKEINEKIAKLESSMHKCSEECQKQIDELKRDMRKTWKSRYSLCSLFLWGIVIILLGAIFFSQIEYFKIRDNHVGLVLGFIGVLATFVVVGNYVQVKEVKNDFVAESAKSEKKIEALEDRIEKLHESMSNAHDTIKELRNLGDKAELIAKELYFLKQPRLKKSDYPAFRKQEK